MILIGDIHIDKNFPYTNKKTAKRWKDLQRETVKNALKLDGQWNIQLGDLFDNFMVSAEDFMRGAEIANLCAFTIQGNHDISNNTEKTSAFELLGRASKTSLVHLDTRAWAAQGVNYVMVPHQLTQEMFEAELVEVASYCTTQIPNVLLLHCNYGDREGTATENYLRPETAKELLKHFTVIASGHEHNANSPLSGVQMCGSILPMNFGEMSDKWVFKVQEDGGLSPIRVWSADANHRKWSVPEFLEAPVNMPLQFIEITGEVNLSESVEISKRIADWYLNSETLIAIKNGTTHIKRDAGGAEVKVSSLDWVQEVLKQMSQEEQEVFQELLNNQQQ